MKRRQHVGKRRAKKATRRKARRFNNAIDQTVGMTPEQARRVGKAISRLRRDVKTPVVNITEEQLKPRLARGTIIERNSFVSDRDGVLWYFQVDLGTYRRV